VWPLFYLSLLNRSTFRVVHKVRNPYAKALQARQCKNLAELHKTFLPLLGPFGPLQLLLHNYRHQRGLLGHGHASKAPFLSATQRSTDVSVTWLRLNSFTMQTFHLPHSIHELQKSGEDDVRDEEVVPPSFLPRHMKEAFK
jgi:hypothetical protein